MHHSKKATVIFEGGQNVGKYSSSNTKKWLHMSSLEKTTWIFHKASGTMFCQQMTEAELSVRNAQDVWRDTRHYTPTINQGASWFGGTVLPQGLNRLQSLREQRIQNHIKNIQNNVRVEVWHLINGGQKTKIQNIKTHRQHKKKVCVLEWSPDLYPTEMHDDLQRPVHAEIPEILMKWISILGRNSGGLPAWTVKHSSVCLIKTWKVHLFLFQQVTSPAWSHVGLEYQALK